MPAMTFVNFYLGDKGEWAPGDVQAIDHALSAAMTDADLNNVMAQYFGTQVPTTAAKPSQTPGIAPPATTDQVAAEKIVEELLAGNQLAGLDLTTTVVNLLLPSGIVLSDSGGAQKLQKLDQESADSLHGLGGYHGSVHVGATQVYYAIGVYSEKRPDGTENGIVAFDKPWKNVVATFYHELNEARTDSDVEDAIRAGNDPSADKFLGWTSSQGYEVGDGPVFEANSDLSLVFKEVPLADGSGTVPIQLMWSNHVHGPEGPIPAPAHA